ncbi:MAG: zinc ribbon domain-containing protein [Methanocorpusculum sp.]|nr:zinc ribbon domain-containing protein [Methanocorpusculum sp.]
MNDTFCQCCGMPMGTTDALYGTEADGSKSKDYCQYCYDKGQFLFTGSMQDMIEFCIPQMVKVHPEMSAEDARNIMEAFLPTLKRWKE